MEFYRLVGESKMDIHTYDSLMDVIWGIEKVKIHEPQRAQRFFAKIAKSKKTVF